MLWFVGLLTALLTSFYMFRLWYLAFLGEPRSEKRPSRTRAPWSMLGPLVILALLSIAAAGSGVGWALRHFWRLPCACIGARTEAGDAHLELVLSIVAVRGGAVGWLVADLFYRQKPERRQNWLRLCPAATSCWPTSTT